MFRAEHQLQRYPNHEMLRQLSDCGHEIPTSLQEPFKNHCPSCLIKAYMRTIQECQYEIAEEGGIFETKRLGSLSGHRHWLLTWRRAKVKLLRNIDMIEDLLEKHGDEDISTQDTRVVLRKALDLYEEEKEDLMSVPGWTPARVETNQTSQENLCGRKSNNEQYSTSQKDPEMSTGPHARLIAEDEVPKVDLPPSTPDTSNSFTRCLRFSQTVTVSPDASSSSSKPTNQVHNPHTEAELARNRRSWWRKGRTRSLDRAWSSPQGYEKVQTSWYRESFEDMEFDVNTALLLEEALDEDLDEEDLDEEDLDKKSLDKKSLDKKSLNKKSLDKESLNEEFLNKESFNEKS